MSCCSAPAACARRTGVWGCTSLSYIKPRFNYVCARPLDALFLSASDRFYRHPFCEGGSTLPLSSWLSSLKGYLICFTFSLFIYLGGIVVKSVLFMGFRFHKHEHAWVCFGPACPWKEDRLSFIITLDLRMCEQ